MAVSKITFQYDIDSKDVTIASERTLNLKQQAKALYTELQNLSLAGKENTVEFELLSKKYNETNDNLARVNAKSKELFGTFSLLPGPIGDIASGLDNSIGLLKTFSAFSLKDIRTQFGNLMDDVGEIISNLLGLNTANKTTAASTQQLAVAQGEAAVSAEANAVATEGMAVAEEGATVATKGLSTAMKALGIGLLIAAVAALVTYWDDLKDAIMGVNEESKLNNTISEKQASISGEQIGNLEKLRASTLANNVTERQKIELVKEYNSKFGDTLGYVKDYIGLQDKLTGPKFEQYKAYLLKKAEAEALAFLIAEQSKKKIEEELKDPSKIAGLYDVWSEGGILGFFIEGKTGTGKAMQTRAIKAFDTTISKLQGKLITVQGEVAAAQKGLGLDTPTPTPTPKSKSAGVNPEIANKKQAIEGIAKLEEEGFMNSLSAREKEEYMVNEKYSKAIYDAIKYKQEFNTLKELQAKELAKISEKYDNEAYKKEIERQKQANQKKSEESNTFYEKQKAKYGEDSKQAIDALNAKYEAELKIYTDELTALNNKVVKGMKLTDDEIKRQGELTLAIAKVATTQEVEGQKSLDREQARQMKKAENQIKALDKELENENTSLQRKKDILAEETRIEKEAYDAAVLAAGENVQKKDEIEAAHTQFLADQANKQVQVEKSTAEAKRDILLSYVDSVGQIGSLLKENAGKNKGLAKAGLIIEQAAGVASIIVNTQKNASKAGYFTPAGIAILLAGAIGVAKAVFATKKGLAEIDKEDSSGSGGGGGATADAGPATSKPRGMATGGLVTGPGTGTSDSVPAMLSSGESVINAASTAMFAPLLSSINQMGGGAKFADGGIAPYSSIDSSQPFASLMGEQPTIKAYVVAQDMTNQQMLDRNAKTRSTI